jgi:ATP phosphoribosyltransferase
MKIGLSKGRIEEVFYERLVNNQVIDRYDFKSRKLETDINEYEFYSLKSDDIITLLSDKYLDIGIVGSDIIKEKNNNNIIELLDLQIGLCSFMLATPPNTDLNSIKKVATKYPSISKELLKSINLDCEIRKMNGSLEIAPRLNYADAIIDLVETGNTLRANGLEEKVRFNNVSAKIVSRKDNKEDIKIKKFIKRIGE